MTNMQSDTLIQQSHAFLRSNYVADLRFDENLRPIKYVIEPSGKLVAPAMVAMLQSVDCVMFIPAFEDDAMEVQVTLEQFDEHSKHGAAADRWRIYHGEPDDVRWAYFHIDMARFEGMVIDGEALMQSNPLAEHEARICRVMNQQHVDELKRLCAEFSSFAVESPVMVGIDPLGIDVRAAFDVVRVQTDKPMQSADEALQTLLQMAGKHC